MTDRQSSQAWNNWYRNTQQNRTYQGITPWLGTWLSLIEANPPSPILELGCGAGIDTQYLAEQGYDILATDYAEEGLKITQRFVSRARPVQLNLEHPLPFRPNTFSVIVGSLSLHYFSWARTQALIAEIGACLKPQGLLLARFNSTGDVHHGATSGIPLEPGYYLVKGRKKRFFNETDVRQLFVSDRWIITSLAEKQIDRFDQPKVIWECIVRKQ